MNEQDERKLDEMEEAVHLFLVVGSGAGWGVDVVLLEEDHLSGVYVFRPSTPQVDGDWRVGRETDIDKLLREVARDFAKLHRRE